MEVEEEDFDDYDEQARLGGGRRPTADESTRISFLSFFLFLLLLFVLSVVLKNYGRTI